MPQDRFLIAPFKTGLQTNLRPWQIMDDAFNTLQNAYVFRGRVRKRFGAQLTGTGFPNTTLAPFFSQVAVLVGTTNGSGNLSGTVPGAIFNMGQTFTVGTNIFTVWQNGTPAAMLSTGPGTGTFNTTTGAFVITGAPINTAVYWYPAQPIMGLTQYGEGPINDQPAIAFDTQFAYQFAGGFWVQFPTPIWHGSNTDFFWATTWQGLNSGLTALTRALFVTNFHIVNPNGATSANDDPIWTYDGTTWSTYVPIFLTDGSFVASARLIVVYHDRLVLLNTIEFSVGANTNTQYQARARFTFVGSPFNADAWLEPNQVGYAGAGYTDAYTTEEIISAQFVKDRLIVFFERSTWELAYTGNQADPFRWYKINTELGSEATFSSVPFDKDILTIGNTGVHACNGANVQRIDTLIPDEIFQFKDPQADTQRIAGIRDYYAEMVYWTFPAVTENSFNTFPNQILVYNYQNSSWALNDDCITAWGYFEQQSGLTWAEAIFSWESANMTWGSGVESAQFRQVIAGNQQGFIFKIIVDDSQNAPVMSITNVTIANTAPQQQIITLTIINHNLTNAPANPWNITGDYIYITGDPTITGIAGPFSNTIFRVVSVIDADTVTIANIPLPGNNFVPITGTYLGGASVTRVSNIQIATKQWNPYVNKDRNFYLSRIDFGVEATNKGEITIDYSPSAAQISLVNDGFGTDSIMGTSVLETSPYALVPLEQFQERLWHPVYFQTDGECIQLFMYQDDIQLRTPRIAFEDFQLEGMILYTLPTAQRLQ
jgi:hypothetical protein